MKTKLLVTAVTAAMLAFGGQASAYTPTVTTVGNNFTMLGPDGGLTGGTNDVIFTWDGTYRTAVVTDGTNNATLSSGSPFSGALWTAHNVNVYSAGTYTFYPGCVAGDASATCTLGGPNPNTPVINTPITITVASDQLLGHMLFDWNGNTNIDVLVLWSMVPGQSWSSVNGSAVFKTGGCSAAQRALYYQCGGTGAGTGTGGNGTGPANSATTVFDAVSMDSVVDVDTVPGVAMIDGPFQGQAANFNVNGLVLPTPVPAAAWLLGSGLIGLAGAARRRSKQAWRMKS